jgi:putative ABC transport system permease protein
MRMSSLWIKVLKDIWSSKARSLLVMLSITVGIFAVGATVNASHIIKRDMDDQFLASHPASATFYLSPFDEHLAPAIEAMHVVEQAEARRVESIEALLGGQSVKMNLIVLPDFENIRLNRFTIQEGNATPGLREIFLERATASMLGVRPGDIITLRREGDDRLYNLIFTGVVHDMNQPLPQWLDVGAGYVSMSTLKWMAFEPYYNTLLILPASKPADKEYVRQVTDEVNERVLKPAGITVSSIQRDDPGKYFGSDIISAVLIVFQVLGLVCILLSCGLVINTISAQVARQTRQIGVMRAVGGGSARITAMYLAMIGIYSLFALLIAIPFGGIGASAIAHIIASLMNFDVSRVDLPFDVVSIQVVVGLLVPLAAGIIPIMSGTHMPVRQAIYQDGNIAAARQGLAEKLLRRLKGIPSTFVLAARNTFRRKPRLAFTLGTLVLAGASFMAAFSAHLMLSRELAAVEPYFLFDVALDLQDQTLRTSAENEASRLPGIHVIEGWYITEADLSAPGGTAPTTVEIAAVPTAPVTIAPHLIAGRWLAPEDVDAVIASENIISDIPDLTVGSRVTLVINTGERKIHRDFVIAGIVSRHYSGRLYVPYGTFTRMIGHPNRITQLRVRTGPIVLQDGESQKALAQMLQRHFDDVGLEVTGYRTQYQAYVSNLHNFDSLLYALVFMAALLALIGGMGLGGTMGLNVLERTREIGVLRAVGGAGASVRQVIIFEGLFVGLVSWVIGAVVSLPLAYALANVLGEVMLDASVSYEISVQGVGLWLAFVVLIGISASLAPARRAARLTIRDLLAYE